MGFLNRITGRYFRRCLLLALWINVCCLCGVVYSAEPPPAETLYLKDGQFFSGESIGFEEGNILFRLPDGEVRSVLLGDVDRLEYAELAPETNAPAPGDELLVSNDNVELPPLPAMINQTPVPQPIGVSPDFGDVEDENTSPWDRVEGYYDTCWDYVEIWTKRMEIGGTFLAGNTQRDYVTTALQLEKSDDNNRFLFEIGGRWGQSNGVRDANRWYGNATLDLVRKTNWIVFITNKNTYDEFENLDWRGNISSGLGYRFINEKDKRLIFRLGPGGTHEVYNSPRLVRTTLDVFAELEFHWPLSDHAKFEHKQTWTPSVNNVKVTRLTTETGILFKLDNKDRWNLRLGLLQIYNSVPNAGRKKNDFTGTVSLVYTRK